MGREVEIKLRMTSAAAARKLLRGAGFVVARRRVLETNTVFDTPDLALRRAGSLVRVRRAGGEGLLTFKGPARIGRHKSREEMETAVASPAAAAAILTRLGLSPVFRYDKYRTEWARRGDAGHVVLDETPVGSFLELEGAPRWIDRTARELGFTPRDYITASYAALYKPVSRAAAASPKTDRSASAQTPRRR
jgi:adenylate cyclase class 2